MQVFSGMVKLRYYLETVKITRAFENMSNVIDTHFEKIILDEM